MFAPSSHTHFRASLMCFFIVPPLLFYYFSFASFIDCGGRVQGSARLFVGPPVPRSLPLLLFQQSQYLAWIRACLLVVHKFSCRRTTDIFFLSFSFLLFVLLEISVVQTFPSYRRRREGLCHSLRPAPLLLLGAPRKRPESRYTQESKTYQPRLS